MKMMKKLIVAAISLTMCISFAACGSNSYDSAKSTYVESAYDSAPMAAYDGDYGFYAEEEYYDGGDGDIQYTKNGSGGSEVDRQQQFDDPGRKLIKTYNLSVETEEFAAFSSAVEAKINELGGYIENLDAYNGSSYGTRRELHYANITARIPANNVPDFLDMVGEKGNITSQSRSVTDVTLNYTDTKSLKESYLVEQQRLLEILETADDLEYIIVLEDKLSEIRYKIESLESQLRSYDNKVDYSTVYLYIQEVDVYTEPIVEPKTYGERLSESFTQSVERVFEGLKDFLVGFVGAIPGFVIFAIVVLIIFVIVKVIIKIVKKQNDKTEAKRRAAYNAQVAAYNASQAAQAAQTAQAQPQTQQTENKES
jgi:large-conductance mechanosensitive channel